MRYYELTALIAVICNLGLTLFILSREPRSTINRVYFLWGFAVSLWNFGNYNLFRTHDPATALTWAHVLQAGVILLPITNLHLTLLIAQVRIGLWLPVLYLLHLGLLVSLLAGNFIVGVRDFGFTYYSVAGPGFWCFLVLYGVSTSATMVMLYHRQLTLPPLHRKRVRSLLLAYTILLAFGTNDLLPILDCDYYPFSHVKIFPIGNIAAVFYVIIVGYSVLQHQLLGLHVTLSKTAAHIVRLLFLFLTGFVLLALLATLFREQFTPLAFFGSLGVLLLSAALASFFFPRLFGRGDDDFERRILGDRFEYHDKIKGFIKSVQWYTDTNLLLNDLHELLVKTVQVQRYFIILLDEKARVFSLFRSHPESPGAASADLGYDSPIFAWFHESKADYLIVNALYASAASSSLEDKARQQLRPFAADFCLPFFSGEDPFGLLLIGEKTNGELYTPHDLRLLTDLVKSLSLIINQIRLKDQILLAQEMDLLGRMSRGMAHDLNNLLTPVWTYLQLASAGVNNREVKEELLPVASRNLEVMRSYVNEALFFSNTLAPKLHLSRLDQAVQQAVELMQPTLKRKTITANLHLVADAQAEFDEVLIQRLITNVLSNAIDASPPGSHIHVELLRLARTETSRDWLRLQITDQGEGISPENLKRVFMPYFTTKDRGDLKRGFGLGLAICRKIVHLHGGTLNISSEERRGTSVRVDLPSRHFKPVPATPVLHA
ncbi:MAG: HAMP domain-containing histidine kinase [Verrucomicrobia bacterium]|nr:HAMP domain-containing histidine kinase [Verrucomicrobiota bacterium]